MQRTQQRQTDLKSAIMVAGRCYAGETKAEQHEFWLWVSYCAMSLIDRPAALLRCIKYS